MLDAWNSTAVTNPLLQHCYNLSHFSTSVLEPVAWDKRVNTIVYPRLPITWTFFLSSQSLPVKVFCSKVRFLFAI